MTSVVNSMGFNQLCQWCRVWDAYGALSNGMTYICTDPIPEIDLRALFDPTEEQNPLLHHL